MLAFLKAWNALPAEVRTLALSLLRAIANSPDPADAARRALEEAGRVRAFDEAMRRRP